MTSVSKFIVKMVFLWGALGAYFLFIMHACEPEAPYVKEGRMYMFKGKYEKAEKKFQRYLKRYPKGTKQTRAKFLLAKTYMGQGQLDEAKTLFQELVKKHGKTTEGKKSLYKLALVQLFRGDLRSASVYASRVISGTSSSMKGEASALNHWLAGGIAKPDHAARRLFRNNFEPKRGGKFVKSGMFRSAIPYLLNRSGDKTQLFLGKAWLGLHDFDQAYTVFDRCAKRYRKKEVGDKCKYKAAMSVLFANTKPDGRRKTRPLLQSKSILPGLPALKNLPRTPSTTPEPTRTLHTREQLKSIRAGVMLPEADALRRWLAR